MKKTTLGERIKARREALGMTQAELAKKAGIKGGQFAVSHYETDKRRPGWPNMSRLLSALGTSILS